MKTGTVLPYGRQSISDSDVEAVVTALRSEFLTGGGIVAQFEREFAARVGAKHAIAVNSATSALHLAMRVLDVGPGHRVITSPNTFLASANAAAFVGAIPDFCDINPDSYNLEPSALDNSWSNDTKAVVPVAYAGQPCDMPEISRIAKQRGAFVIEDACHAVGSEFEHFGQRWRTGGHAWADITTFSFHPVKTMTCGEGGMLTTENDDWAKKARQLRSHGIERTSFVSPLELPILAERGSWFYEMQDLGYNYRLTDIQSALGLSQLNRLGEFIRRRSAIVARYNSAFSGLRNLSTPKVMRPASSDAVAWHLYTVRISFDKIGVLRSEFMRRLREKGIGSQVLYIPVYLQPWYAKRYGYRPGKCPAAEGFYKEALSLPLYPDLSDHDVERVIAGVSELINYI